jgi:hypothetical protein
MLQQEVQLNKLRAQMELQAARFEEEPPVKTFPQLSQNRNRKLEKDFSRLRTQWRIFLSISRTSSRAPVLT